MPADQLDCDADPDSLDALLLEALDGADPVRLNLMAAWFFLTHDTSREADMAKMRRDGPTPVYSMS